MKPKTGTIVRVIMLVIALANMALSTMGIVPMDIVGNSQAYEIGSVIITAVLSVLNMWKNNSFTKEAIMADEYMKQLKSPGDGEAPTDTDK